MNRPFFMAFAILVFVSCMSKKATNIPVGDNSMNAVDWPGVYAGTLPCADCEGILTELKLNQDLTYSLSQTYQGRSEQPIKRSGKFSWNSEGTKITLDNAHTGGSGNNFQVGENLLFQLDQQGNRITGDLASKYQLVKLNTSIVNKYWKLVELLGQPFTMAAGDKRESHILLSETDHRLSGTGGCNNFVGSYQLLPGDRIRFSQNMSTTLLPCQANNREAELLKVLEQADNYSVSGDTMLTLNRMRMAPLARFKVVYFN